MPFFKVETNCRVDDATTNDLLKKASVLVSQMLGKPEKFVMVSIDTDKRMMFGGDGEPTAFVQLKSIGLPTDRCAEFSGKICQFLTDDFGIQPDRVFIDFKDAARDLFGWNGRTF